MRNITLTRIDDRLIHGQVVTAWIKRYPINRILIIDDELSKNRLMERIYKAAAPVGVDVLIMSIHDSVIFLKEDSPKGEHILLLVKVPQVLEELVKEEISIEKIILGGMGAGKGRKTFIKNVSASQAEAASLKALSEQNIEIVYQLIPDEKEINIKKLL